MEYAALTNRYVTHRHTVAINCPQFQPPHRQSRLDFPSPFINGLLSDGSQRSLFSSVSTTVGTLTPTLARWRFGTFSEGPPADEQDSSLKFILNRHTFVDIEQMIYAFMRLIKRAYVATLWCNKVVSGQSILSCHTAQA